MYNAIGIDVSKNKSTVAVMNAEGVLIQPFDIENNAAGVAVLIDLIQKLDGENRAILECTSYYHEPITAALTDAGVFCAAVNPKIIKRYTADQNALRPVKTDNADALKIARYGLDRWAYIQPFDAAAQDRYLLKITARQYEFMGKQIAAQKNNLIGLLDRAFPGINEIHTSPKANGRQKWVDFAADFWHADVVRRADPEIFGQHYALWCKENNYNNRKGKSEQIYNLAKNALPVLPCTEETKTLIKTSIDQLKNTLQTQAEYCKEMQCLAKKMPEYEIVLEMGGVGELIAPQLIAEIGDVQRFHSGAALAAYAGVDPGIKQSGKQQSKTGRTTKNGSPHLRRTLFIIMQQLIKSKSTDDPVYIFMDRKRRQGKPYRVYMTAGANKFLKIYYDRVVLQ